MPFFYVLAFLLLLLLVAVPIILTRRKKLLNLDENSVIVITGACKGIGRRTALKLGAHFKSIIVVFDIDLDMFQDLERELRSVGCTPFLYICDISNEQHSASTAAEVLKKFGRIDLLINNAGIVYGETFLDTSLKKIDHVMNVNFMGPVRMMKAFLPKMIEQNRGQIVNVASVASFMYSQNLAGYSASKWALYAFHSSIRLELKISNVNVGTTLICPYLTNTGMFEGYKPFLSRLFPPLDPSKVADKIVNSVVNRTELVIIPWVYSPLVGILNCLPIFLLDLLIRIMRNNQNI